MGLALRYAESLNHWLRALQAEILPIILSSAHLKRDARGHETFGRVTIITHQTKPPVGEIDAFADRVDDHNAEDMARLGSVIGIRIADISVDATKQEFRNENVGKIESLANDQLDDMTELLAKAEDEGWHATELAEQIELRFGVAQSKAALLARDQILKLNGQLTEERQTNAGITRYIWTTAGDERVRESHAELEGTEQTWGAPPVVDEKNDRHEAPGGDYMCRCVAYPVVEF